MSSELISFDPNPRLRWLFCLAHPDDELAVCAWIRVLTSVGASVTLSWMHDTAVREREARAVAQRLGVPEGQLYFHHAPDGNLIDDLPRWQESLREVVMAVEPDRVVTLAFEQGHLDHDATNFLVNQVFSGPVFEFPMYHGYHSNIMPLNEFGSDEPYDTYALDSDQSALKRTLLNAYPSQTIRRNVVGYGWYRRLTLRPVYLDRRELLRPQTHRDWLRPNLRPYIARKVIRSARWQRWVKAMNANGQNSES
jgi:LmbE family N-acetylglucosaminyl deacetylase